MTSYTETWPPSGLVRHFLSVRLSRSLFVPGRQLKKGGSPPFPPALGSHTRVATKRRVGFRSPASHTRVAAARAERDAPTPMCFFFFFSLSQPKPRWFNIGKSVLNASSLAKV